jgi:hypothetical protein
MGREDLMHHLPVPVNLAAHIGSGIKVRRIYLGRVFPACLVHNNYLDKIQNTASAIGLQPLAHNQIRM